MKISDILKIIKHTQPIQIIQVNDYGESTVLYKGSKFELAQTLSKGSRQYINNPVCELNIVTHTLCIVCRDVLSTAAQPDLTDDCRIIHCRVCKYWAGLDDSAESKTILGLGKCCNNNQIEQVVTEHNDTCRYAKHRS